MCKNIDMARKVVSVVFDTNVLISGIAFGGKPREILEMIKNKEVLGVTSLVLLAELMDVLSKNSNIPNQEYFRWRENEKFFV